MSIFSALRSGNVDDIKDALESMDAETLNKIHSTANAAPIHIATHIGNPEIVQLFVDAGADVNIATPLGETPLLMAVDEENEPVVKLLLAAGANPNKRNPRNRVKTSALERAIKARNLSLVRDLVAAGADINAMDGPRIGALGNAYRDPTRGNALYFAIEQNDVAIAEFLIDSGADMNNVNGDSALTMAINKRARGIFNVLLENGANLNYPEVQLPLITAMKQNNDAFVQKLLDSGADINAVDSHGMFPLLYAVDAGKKRWVSYLIAHGADIHKRHSKSERTVFFDAAMYQLEIAKLLLDAGADVNAVDIHGNSVLGYVVRLPSDTAAIPAIKFLLEAGAVIDPNIVRAAQNGYYSDAINALIRNAAAAVAAPAPVAASLPHTAPPANIASLSKCFDPAMADEANISMPSMAVFYIQNAAGNTVSTGCLEKESLDMYKALDSFVFYRCKDTVPVSALHITEDSVFPTKYRKLGFAMTAYVHDAEFQQTQIGKMYVLRPVEPLGRIASQSVVEGGSVVSANHCGPASAGDVLYSIHEVATAAVGGRRRQGLKDRRTRRQGLKDRRTRRQGPKDRRTRRQGPKDRRTRKN